MTRQRVQPNAAARGDFVEEVLPIPGLQGELFLASGNTSSADASVPRSPGVLAPGGSSFPSIHTPRAMLTSMATEDLLVHNGSDGQAVEAISEGLPQFDVVASLACPGRRRAHQRASLPLPQPGSPGLPGHTVCCSDTARRRKQKAKKETEHPPPYSQNAHCLPDNSKAVESPGTPESHFWHNLKVGTHPQHKSRARLRRGLVHLGFWLTEESSPDKHSKCLSTGCTRGDCEQVRPCLRILAALQSAATSQVPPDARTGSRRAGEGGMGWCYLHGTQLSRCLSDADTPATRSARGSH